MVKQECPLKLLFAEAKIRRKIDMRFVSVIHLLEFISIFLCFASIFVLYFSMKRAAHSAKVTLMLILRYSCLAICTVIRHMMGGTVRFGGGW